MFCLQTVRFQLPKPNCQAICVAKIYKDMHIHSQVFFIRTKGSVRVYFLQSRESVSVSLYFLSVSSSCLQLSCQSVCYMQLLFCFCVCITYTVHGHKHGLCKCIIVLLYTMYFVYSMLSVYLSNTIENRHSTVHKQTPYHSVIQQVTEPMFLWKGDLQ